MQNIERKIIAIVGPTASGKTAIGVKLAKEFNGEIVSADSRQIFRGLDLGTGKEGQPCWQETISKKQETNHRLGRDPVRMRDNQQFNNSTIEQLRQSIRRIDGVDQWMIDICDPGEDFNLFKYIELAKMAIEDIFSRGKVPIIVGGTGLYVQALVEGFELASIQNTDNRIQQSIIPAKAGILKIPDQVRNDERGREQFNNLTIEQLQKILKDLNEESFEKLVDKQNPHRLIRAIERVQSGEEMTKTRPDFDVLQIGLDWSREILNERIDRRVDERFEQGMLKEVIGLLQRGVDANWLLKLGLEYRIITDFVLQIAKLLNCSIADLNNITIKQYNNEFVSAHSSSFPRKRESRNHRMDPRVPLSSRIAGPEDDTGAGEQLHEFELMTNQLKLKSHQYAKRQITWFKRFPEIVWESDYEKIKSLVGLYLKDK